MRSIVLSPSFLISIILLGCASQNQKLTKSSNTGQWQIAPELIERYIEPPKAKELNEKEKIRMQMAYENAQSESFVLFSVLMSRNKHMAEWEQACLLGFLAYGPFRQSCSSQHKKAERGFREKSHAAKSSDQVEEPEAGRMVQTQVSNLVNGVVLCPMRITAATNVKVGARGTKLLERVR